MLIFLSETLETRTKTDDYVFFGTRRLRKNCLLKFFSSQKKAGFLQSVAVLIVFVVLDLRDTSG